MESSFHISVCVTKRYGYGNLRHSCMLTSKSCELDSALEEDFQPDGFYVLA